MPPHGPNLTIAALAERAMSFVPPAEQQPMAALPAAARPAISRLESDGS
jgi:hypothetical protein